jgi:hypothetical protein
MLNATVTKVLINPTTKTAEGVEFITKGSKQTVRASKEVILAAGALNSPQLLLLSGVGPSQDLARVGVPLVHDLRGVGQNLHNHVAVFINFLLNENATMDLDWAAATEYMLSRSGPLAGTGLSQVRRNSTAFLSLVVLSSYFLSFHASSFLSFVVFVFPSCPHRFLTFSSLLVSIKTYILRLSFFLFSLFLSVGQSVFLSVRMYVRIYPPIYLPQSFLNVLPSVFCSLCIC